MLERTEIHRDMLAMECWTGWLEI